MSTAGDGNGGRIGQNNPTTARPGNNPLVGGAPGIWNIQEVYNAITRNEWPRYYNSGTVVASGGSITTTPSPNGAYIVHTFLSSGTFTITSAPSSTVFEYLVVAGGGGGGSTGPAPVASTFGGNGGGGGVRQGSVSGITSGTWPVTVGAGGGSNAKGSDSSIGSLPEGTFTSTGGGQGGSAPGFSGPLIGSGQPGGSGGGGGSYNGGVPGNPAMYRPGGTGNTPPTSPPQGFNGGNGPGPLVRGGGGGAGGSGTNSANGPGISYDWIDGVTSIPYGAGGVGSTANRGGGGLGATGTTAGPVAGGAGGPGVVIIRYSVGGV